MEKPLSEKTLKELWELFPIILKEHNPDYRNWYETEKEYLFKIIGANNIKRMNHIGSTAVDGLIAKPTIDILLEISDICDIVQLKSKLINSGWTCMSYEDNPELKISFNKGYTPKGFAEKVFHLHVRYLGDWSELYFRDFLRINPNIAKEYGRLKIDLKEKYEHNRDAYTEAKSEFVIKYTKIAKNEFKNRYKLNV